MDFDYRLALEYMGLGLALGWFLGLSCIVVSRFWGRIRSAAANVYDA